MPAKRRTAPVANSSNGNSDGDDNKDEAYRKKRQRNNDAVKKTREKTKKNAEMRSQHVTKLIKENEELNVKINEGKKNIKYLKGLLLTNSNSNEHDEMVKQILEEPSDDDE